ncbi:MAG TPA: MltA domain-containing protein [Burkholderiaceae bacterium]|nr:MltA domain-containing protein [Burkholderiaceae bacterium]
MRSARLRGSRSVDWRGARGGRVIDARGLGGCVVALILGIAAGCAEPAAPAAPPPTSPAAAPVTTPAAPPAAAPRAAPAATPAARAIGPVTAGAAAATTIVRARARWVPASWSELPGFADDRTRELWPALLAGCAKPADGWAGVCALARALQPADDVQAREFLQRTLQPYRVEALDGQTQGLATGYFEPLLAASRVPRGAQHIALLRPPADLATRRPWWTRAQLDTVPAARASARGSEIAYVADPLDALLVQVQGSGRLRVTERDGRERMSRIAYAGHNDHVYKSVGRWLIEQGELRDDEASWPAIRDWARRYPERVNELVWSNPRVVFFREEPLPDETIGPRGAQGVPLTPARSVAVDPLAVPYGTVLWLDTTEPMAAQQPLRRAVMAQDTGSAINGAVRVDYFWGWGALAEAQAGRMKQPLRLWALWPR